MHGVAHVIVIIWIKPSSFSKDNIIEIYEISAIQNYIFKRRVKSVVSFPYRTVPTNSMVFLPRLMIMQGM